MGFEEQGLGRWTALRRQSRWRRRGKVSPQRLSPCRWHRPLHCHLVPLLSSCYLTLLFKKKIAKNREKKKKNWKDLHLILFSPSATVWSLHPHSYWQSLFWVFALCYLRDQWQSISLAHSNSLPQWSLVDALFIEKSPTTFPPGFLFPFFFFFFNSPIYLFVLKFPTHREV